MKNPRYMEELLKIIFAWLGFMFVCSGILCVLGIMKPTAHSMIQDSTLLGGVFSALGMTFILVHFILRGIAYKKNKLYSDLMSNGIKLQGEVEKVYLQRYIQYRKRYPYRIAYHYRYQDKEYHHKSGLLWEKPELSAGDQVVVYVNDSGKSVMHLFSQR